MSLFQFFKHINTALTSKRCRQSFADISVHLDRIPIENKIPNWRQMNERVHIEFVKRDITTLGLGPAHWAFLIASSLYFCIIEYGIAGIELHFYYRDRGIKEACAGIMGNVNYVYYDDRWQTDRTFADILEVINTMKFQWNTSTFQTLSRNCQHFILELGRLLFPDFEFLDFMQALRNPRSFIYHPIDTQFKYRSLL